MITSIVDGSRVPGVRTAASTNPAQLDQVVGEVSFGDAGTFVAAAESAKKAAESCEAIPATMRGRAIAHIGGPRIGAGMAAQDSAAFMADSAAATKVPASQGDLAD